MTSSSVKPIDLAFYAVEPNECDNKKAPIIFIHGVTTSKEFWNDIPKKVAEATRRKVYAVDLRNHGESDWSDTDNFDCNVLDLLHFMDARGVPKAVLVGHSLGGATAMRVAWMENERVEKLVVEDMPVRMVPTSIHDMVLLQVSLNEAATKQMPSGLKEDAARDFICDFVYNGLPEEIKKVITKPTKEHYEGKLKPTENGGYTFRCNVSAIQKSIQKAKTEHPETSGVYHGPACFIYGGKSPFQVGSDEENIKKFFPNAELVGIENAAHLETPGLAFRKRVISYKVKMDRWKGRVVLVTGASAGIGAQICQTLAANGMHVVGCAREAQRIPTIAQNEAGGSLIGIKCDLSREEDILNLFSEIRSRFGRIDVCINNAGLSHNVTLLSTEENATQLWRNMIDVNIMALCICTREAHVRPPYAERRPSYVRCHQMYAESLAEGLRREFREEKSGIRVACLSPGLTETEFAPRCFSDVPGKASSMYESLKCLQPEDIAEGVLYVLRSPPHVDIHDVLLRPTAQAT
ncbi:hypothetical protein JTE90_023686 [Oedothorax gibbosus]|uniref:AB hydrolase-1 domain-containing protein n=1 Tax=Oedothorax gibbosus TaxID=931172 RepID=A0AAV6TX85_9ARAC|nr:hypothetical protein JTE90_023686 [Oedothorax gibbosus]